MEWLIDNWFVLAGVLAIVIAVVVMAMKFIGLPTSEQLKKVKEWLLWAVSKAESELGSGTGELKLRYVYDMFVEKFPLVAKLVSFEFFSTMVDEALEEMRKLLENNVAVNTFINGIK